MKKILTLLALLFFATNIFAQSDLDAAQKEHFEKHYRETWDKLSEFEQYAIAFSSNLFQLNEYYHLDFSAKSIGENDREELVELLEDSWGITDYDTLMETFENLLSKINKYEDKDEYERKIDEVIQKYYFTKYFMVKK